MKKLNKVFWISFGVYSIFTVIEALVIERNENNLGFLINMKGYIPLIKYYTLVGLVFFVIAFISMLRNNLRYSKTVSLHNLEMKELKAKLFDLQKNQRSRPQEPSSEGTQAPKTEE